MPKIKEINTRTLHLTHGQIHLRYTTGKAAPILFLHAVGLTTKTPWFFKAMLMAPLSSLLFSKLLGPPVWRGYIKSLYRAKKYKNDDFLKKRFCFLKQPERMTALLKNLIPLNIDRVALHTRIPGFNAPACVIYGENDPEFSIEYGKELAQTLGGKFVKITEAGHFVHEDQPHHVAENISSWINGTLSDSCRSSV